MSSFWTRTLRSVGRAFRRGPAPDTRTSGRNDDHRRPARPGRARVSADGQPAASSSTVGYDAERLGLPPLRYTPHPDDLPDPGEVVWTWVPYEDDPKRGKDRPVLVLARIADSAVVIQMTSKDHDRDAAQEAQWGRYWMDIGSGDWDSRRRPSEVRLDRLLQVPLEAVRRTGGALDERRYNAVVAELRKHHS